MMYETIHVQCIISIEWCLYFNLYWNSAPSEESLKQITLYVERFFGIVKMYYIGRAKKQF